MPNYGANLSIIAIDGKGNVNMYGGQVSGGYVKNCACIKIGNGKLNMYNDSLITDGLTKGHGGNVYVAASSTRKMYGNAAITDGQCKKAKTDFVASKDANYADIFAANGFTLTMNGGHVGRMAYGGSAAANYNFSGKFTIDFLQNFKHAANIIGTLDADTSGYLTNKSEIKIVDAGTWTPEQPTEFAKCFTGPNGSTGAARADGIYLQTVQ